MAPLCLKFGVMAFKVLELYKKEESFSKAFINKYGLEKSHF
jgi:hypothetical protein